MGDSPGGLGSHNLPFIEELYAQYRADPASVDPGWASWFQHMEAGEDGLNGVRLGPSFGLRSIFNPSEGEALHPVHLEALDAPPTPVVPMHGHDVAAKVPFLRSLAMFQDLPESELPEVARIAHEVAVEAGRSIVREGEMGRDMYIITEGQVLVGRGGRMVASWGRATWWARWRCSTASRAPPTRPRWARCVCSGSARRTCETPWSGARCWPPASSGS